MNRFFRFYNQNKQNFWIVIIAIVMVIVIIQSLNNFYKNKNAKEESSGISNTTTSSVIQNPTITGKELNQTTSTITTNIIDNFIKLCNSGKPNEAYQLLSLDCKEQLFSTEEEFENKYYNKIFQEERLYDIENWITTSDIVTYRINITENLLATGGKSNFKVSDYFTVVKENGEYKLNINNYIGKETIGVSSKTEDIEITVVEKYVYSDYEIYNLKVKNNSDKKIMLDSKQNARTINIIGNNEQKYVAFLNELSENDLTIIPGITKEIKIKFNKAYNPNYVVEYIEFNDIVLNENNKQLKNSLRIEL